MKAVSRRGRCNISSAGESRGRDGKVAKNIILPDYARESRGQPGEVKFLALVKAVVAMGVVAKNHNSPRLSP